MHLNLPTYQFKITKQNEKPFIYDIIRRKLVSLTPEEWVRQHIINFLVNYKNFNKTLIAVERKLSYLNSFKRFDILVFNNKAEPEILIECKAPTVNLTSETALQLALYNQQYKAKIIIISNGINHFAWQLDINSEYQSFSFFE
ncbi:MAG: type I restriction enzyme HsdR N-terminal domain-containing protein [Bacteroidia bacterium]